MKLRDNSIINEISNELFKNKKSFGNPNNKNILFKGDNLNILNLIEPKFRNKIKLIYIDPPYNTQNNFDHYNDELSHSKWLNMMEERLRAMLPLLTEDGSIWISIDDNEFHYLKVLCDEIFERKNFVSSIIWEKKYSPSNDNKYISASHDYILVYAKNKSKWDRHLLPRTQKLVDRYKNIDDDGRGAWMSSDLTVKTPSRNYVYPIVSPSGKVFSPSKSRSWAVSKKRFQQLVKDNRIWFGINGDNMPRLKRFLSEVQNGIVPKTIWLRDEVGDNQEAKKEVKKVNSIDVFTTPKPERLLKRIIEISSNKGDWVLDAFAGSGTTGAVAHKLNRNWIMIEINGSCESHCLKRMTNIINGKDDIGVSKEKIIPHNNGFYFVKLK